ncbi:MAG TPA: hypothetical protein VMD78_00530 [Candidatus Baltobacteraceae bacterium]|nr:hypothetical protein [Candidatus Baltobacteraceae bacterium]
MRFGARYYGVLCAVALVLPTAQASQHVERKVAGVVSEANLGHIDSADAVGGANVYNCDTVETEQGGQMRLQVRGGQVFVASGSEGQLQSTPTAIDVYVERGTLGFSVMAGGMIEVVTPAGLVRAANGQAASGEVTMTGPKEMLVSALHGDLVLDNGGQIRTIPQGQMARVTFDEGNAPACYEDESQDQQQQHFKTLRRPIGFYLLLGGAVAIPAILLWHVSSESKYTPTP